MKNYSHLIALKIICLITVINCLTVTNNAYYQQPQKISSQQQGYNNLINQQQRTDENKIVADQIGQIQIISRQLQICSTNCISCLAGICSTCDTQFYLDNSNQCISCNSIQINCVSCMLLAPPMNTAICTSCDTGFYLDIAKTPNCQSCVTSIPNCLDCKIDIISSILICQPDNCQPGFYRSASGTLCIACNTIDPLCTLCTFNLQGMCTECQGNNYATVDTGKCLPCNIPACNRCDNVNVAQAPQCSTCNLMFYRNPTTFQCIACKQNCMDCFFNPVTSLEECIQCGSGYFLSGNVCLPCSTSLPFCSTCGFDINLVNNCLTCQAGYLLKADPTKGCEDCTGKINNCKTCTVSQQLPICLECNPNFIKSVDQISCLACNPTLCPVNPPACTIPSCLSCTITNPILCNQCVTNYVLTNNKLLCSPCSIVIKNCTTCSSAIPTTCITCLDDSISSLDKKKCILCSQIIRSCNTCTALTNTLTKCTSCLQNKYPTTTANSKNKCLLCSSVIPYCFTCILSAGVTKCIRCQKQYILRVDQLKCQRCKEIVPHCKNCTVINGTNVCLKCYDGLIALTNNYNIYACRPCGAYIGQCKSCTVIMGVAKCTACRQGSKLNKAGTQCFSCPSNCKTCTGNNICSSCSTGFSLMKNQCYKCQLINCLVCQLDRKRRAYCKVCLPKYQLRGGYCTSNKK